jgi:ParB family chromosome partitioning protein
VATSRRGGLGRGLGALIPQGESGLLEVDVDRVAPNPQQPRYVIEESALRELVESIRQHGVLQPLIVTRADDGSDGYLLVAGERRWRAAREAGLRIVPVVVKETTPRQRLELALVENLQRQDLSPLETAQAYRQLIDEHGLTQEAVAERVGKNRVTVANALRLLRLPSEAREALARGEITEGHARAILACPAAADRKRLLGLIRERELSVREAEEQARRLNTAEELPSPDDGERRTRRPISPDLAALEDELRHVLGTKVQLQYGRRGGKLIIHFYSDDELQGIYETIRGSDSTR